MKSFGEISYEMSVQKSIHDLRVAQHKATFITFRILATLHTKNLFRNVLIFGKQRQIFRLNSSGNVSAMTCMLLNALNIEKFDADFQFPQCI